MEDKARIDKAEFNLLVELFNCRAKHDVIGIPYDEFRALGKAIDVLRPLLADKP